MDVNAEIREIRTQLEAKNVHGTGLSVPLPSSEAASRFKIGIIRTCWHAELIDLMESKCISKLIERGVKRCNVLRTKVSGSFELPYVAQKMIQNHEVDAVVVIGILLKGGTIHMEVIAHAATSAIFDVQRMTGVPIVFGVLTVLSIEQAKERAESELGGSWGEAALAQAAWNADKDSTELLLETA